MAKSSKAKAKAKMNKGPVLEQLLAKEIEKGKKIARDPQNALLHVDALRITNASSEWLNNDCYICKFKFREGDRIRICPNCELPFHQDEPSKLLCWSNLKKESSICPRCKQDIHQDSEEEERNIQLVQETAGLFEQAVFAQFSTGIKQEWFMFGEEDGVVEPKVMQDPNDPNYGKKCMICEEGIRLGDRYVECPGDWKCCFHADVLRHLTCWSTRFNLKNTDYCLLSGGCCKIELNNTNL